MRNLKKLTQNYFIFSKKERNVALYLAAVIVLITLLPSFQKEFFRKQNIVNYESLYPILISIPLEEEVSYNENYTAYNKKFVQAENHYPQYSETETFLNSASTSENIKLFVFDPNLITVDQWVQLGISSWLAERIVNYRSKGGKFKKKEDLLKTYGFTNADFVRLEPFILIDTTQFILNNKLINNHVEITEPHELIEINTALKEQFMELGFSADNAIRIIKFRESAGGIYSLDQLHTVFGIDMQTLENVKAYLTVDKNHLIKININTVSFEQLANHAYISDELAQAIIDYKNLTGKFYSINELMKVKGMYPSLFEKLKPYLIL